MDQSKKQCKGWLCIIWKGWAVPGQVLTLDAYVLAARCSHADCADTLACRLSHAPFLRAAKQRAQRGARRIAVDQTLQFLRLVPPAAADPKSCTAAVAVCATACKPEAAQEVARLFRASGGIPDEPFYAALIVGALPT